MTDGLTVYRLPRSHYHCTLAGFDWAGVKPPGLKQAIDNFLAAAGTETAAPHLLLVGTPGIGKTHLGIAVYRALTVVHGTELVTWLNVPQFCEKAKRAFNDPTEDPWEDLEAAKRGVVLDDLFGKELSEYEMRQIVPRILDTAYQNGAAVLCTMNVLEDVEARLEPHEQSRLLAQHVIVKMEAKDHRRVK